MAASFGDAAQFDPGLFDGCAAVATRTIVNQRVAPAPMETRAAAAAWGKDAGKDAGNDAGNDGRLTAWIPTQGAQETRVVLAAMLGVDPAGSGSSPRTWGARSARSSARIRSTGWCAGSPGNSAAPRAGPRPATRTWSR